MIPIDLQLSLRKLLMGSLCLAAALGLHRYSIAPLRASEHETRRKIEDLRGRIETAGREIEEVQELEQQAERAGVELQQLQGEQPTGSVMVWFPELIAKHFPNFGAPVTFSHLSAALEEPELPGYQQVFWAVGLQIDESNRNVQRMLFAAAEFENKYPFSRIVDFAIRSGSKDPHHRIAKVRIAAMVPK